MWQEFLRQFIGEPIQYYTSFPKEFIIRCEATHFLFSCFSGYLAFLLMQTTLYHTRLRFVDHYIFRISLLFGVCLSVTAHIILDAFTQIA